MKVAEKVKVMRIRKKLFDFSSFSIVSDTTCFYYRYFNTHLIFPTTLTKKEAL